MDEATFKGRVKRLKEVNTVIKDLEPAIREGAFELLRGYVASPGAIKGGDGGSGDRDASSGGAGAGSAAMDVTGAEEFFTKFDHAKPADNAKLVAAYHYSQFGADAFSLDEVRELADDVGLTVPERLDMTFLDTRKDGKNLFKRAGRGKFRPTVHGEKFLKESYKIKKGTKKKPEAGKE